MRFALFAFAIAVAEPSVAARAGNADEAGDDAARYALGSVRIEPAPASDGRYTLRARLAPQESAGELREGSDFTLIGRFAKTAASCGPTGAAIFRDGFEN